MIKLKILIVCAVAALSAYAIQRPNNEGTYLAATLRGQQAEAPTRTFKLKHLAAERARVWVAWQQANAAWAEPGLPPLDSIGAAPRGQWQLPDSLEPRAVMPFYFGYKGAKPQAGYPLFLYLHGSGPKDKEWTNGLYFARHWADGPSLYFVPQIPNEGRWYRWYQRSKQFAWNRLLRQALLRPDVDPNRLYVTGISEGGYGSQRLASFYADYWAAAGPMAGGEPLKNAPAENLSQVPFSFLTGAEDKEFYRDILTGYTRDALDSLAAQVPGSYVHRIELIPGKGHHIDYRPTTPWLARHTRNPWPRRYSWEDYEMDSLHRSGFYNLIVDERPVDSLRTRYDVDIHDNEVNIEVRNVHYTTTQIDPVYGIEMKFARTYEPARTGRFTVMLDEHLVDLSRPVRVVVNGREVFQGRLKLDRCNLLRSVATFYDPCRLYPAAVEVSL